MTLNHASKSLSVDPLCNGSPTCVCQNKGTFFGLEYHRWDESAGRHCKSGLSEFYCTTCFSRFRFRRFWSFLQNSTFSCFANSRFFLSLQKLAFRDQRSIGEILYCIIFIFESFLKISISTFRIAEHDTCMILIWSLQKSELWAK